ncbi:hypothetical protein [Actinomadura sp. 3N508]|uniref:hypothetical protein n=1 Tax=Actinomadura sp. 3N508 TaxID=3375153 RepID=UPI00379F39AC
MSCTGSPHHLDQLAANGLREVAFGIESGGKRMLAHIDKRITPAMVRSVVRRLTERGIADKGYFILGLPIETRAEPAHTVPQGSTERSRQRPRERAAMPTETIFPEYNRFLIGPPGCMPGSADPPAANGLAEAARDPAGAALIDTGVKDDPITVTAELADRQPAVDAEAWEDIVVIGIDWTGGPMQVVGADDTVAPSLMTFTPDLPPGRMMILVAARNRDYGEARGDDEPTEEYLLIAWPGDEPDQAIKQESLHGADIRQDRQEQDALVAEGKGP